MRRLAIILACAGFAAPQSEVDARKIIEVFEKASEAGVLAAVLEHVPGDALDDPAVLHEVAAWATKNARTYAKREPDAWKDLHQRLQQVCEKLPERTADVLSAEAETLLCGAHIATVLGEPVEADVWTKAADRFLEAHKSKQGRAGHFERATQSLLEGGRQGGADAATLFARADELALEGAGKYANNTYFAVATHRAHLRRILATMKSSASKAKKMAKDYAEDLDGRQARSGGPDVDSMFNDLVTFGREHKKAGLKLKYRTEEMRLGGVVRFDVPISDHWVKEEGEIRQYDEDGILRRAISVDTFRWDTKYYAGSLMFSGENIKGLARVGEAGVLEGLADVKRKERIRKVRLSKAIPKAQAFVVGGVDEDGDYRCCRYAYFKAAKNTVMVGIVDYVEEKDLDPEAEFVLSTVRE